MNIGLRILNVLFHLLHITIIFFLLLGWIFPSTRLLHLIFIICTLGSWVISGSCPLTELHWRIRRAAALPPVAGPYIPYLLSRLMRRPVDTRNLDKGVVMITVVIALASAFLNVQRIF
jgi:hypothetical protein